VVVSERVHRVSVESIPLSPCQTRRRFQRL
jgi:hypothetical protein